MKGIVSFHPIDPRFFESVVGPLVGGASADVDAYLESAVRARRNAVQAARWTRAIHAIVEGARPPRIEPLLPKAGSARELVMSSVGLVRSPRTVLEGIKARLDRYDFKLDDLSSLVVAKIVPELHLFGRPFLIAEASPRGVADAVDAYRSAASTVAVDNLAVEQLTLLDPGLARIEPDATWGSASDFEYRAAVFRDVQAIAGLPRAAREAQAWLAPDGSRRPAAEVLKSELAWRAVSAHSRVNPSWISRDVDGIETMCSIAGLPPTSFAETVEGLFPKEAAPLFGDSLHRELLTSRDVGAYVAPDRISHLLDFLTAEGARILRAAARFGEGPTAEMVLRKIRECATYSSKHGLGYLEASGIVPVDKPELAESVES